jgi:uncharacterized protein (DUF58 family)
VEFAAVAAYIITRHGDKVGAMAFPSADIPIVPPRTGRRHTLRLLHTLQQGDGKGHGPTDLTATLRNAAGMLKRRHMIFVVSDFIAPGGWEQPLRELGQRHDMVAVWIRDPAEEALPDVGMVPVRDPETGAHCWVDTSDSRVRDAFAALVAARRTRVMDAFRYARVDHLELSTAESLVDPLVRFVLRRRRRQWSSPGR